MWSINNHSDQDSVAVQITSVPTAWGRVTARGIVFQDFNPFNLLALLLPEGPLCSSWAQPK